MRRRNRFLVFVVEVKNYFLGDYLESRWFFYEKVYDYVIKIVYRDVCSNFQLRFREIQRKWWFDLVDKKQFCIGIGNFKVFFKFLYVVYSLMY